MNAMASQCERGHRDRFGWPNPKCQLQEELDPVIAIQQIRPHATTLGGQWSVLPYACLCGVSAVMGVGAKG